MSVQSASFRISWVKTAPTGSSSSLALSALQAEEGRALAGLQPLPGFLRKGGPESCKMRIVGILAINSNRSPQMSWNNCAWP